MFFIEYGLVDVEWLWLFIFRLKKCWIFVGLWLFLNMFLLIFMVIGIIVILCFLMKVCGRL